MKTEILIGNIASGKSTYCRKRANEGALIINDDSIVNAVHCDIYTLYDENLKPLYKAVENQILTLGLALGRDIIIDRGLNLTPNSRRRWIGMSDSFDAVCHAVVFEFEEPSIHAERRQGDNMRGHDYEYWLGVADKFFHKYKKPTFEEGFDEIVHYQWQKKNQ